MEETMKEILAVLKDIRDRMPSPVEVRLEQRREFVIPSHMARRLRDALEVHGERPRTIREE